MGNIYSVSKEVKAATRGEGGGAEQEMNEGEEEEKAEETLQGVNE